MSQCAILFRSRVLLILLPHSRFCPPLRPETHQPPSFLPCWCFSSGICRTSPSAPELRDANWPLILELVYCFLLQNGAEKTFVPFGNLLNCVRVLCSFQNLGILVSTSHNSTSSSSLLVSLTSFSNFFPELVDFQYNLGSPLDVGNGDSVISVNVPRQQAVKSFNILIINWFAVNGHETKEFGMMFWPVNEVVEVGLEFFLYLYAARVRNIPNLCVQLYNSPNNRGK